MMNVLERLESMAQYFEGSEKWQEAYELRRIKAQVEAVMDEAGVEDLPERPEFPTGPLLEIDRLHILDWIDNRLTGALWDEEAIAQRVMAEQHLIIAASRVATNRDPYKVIAELTHELARARVAIHYEETRKAWLEAGR